MADWQWVAIVVAGLVAVCGAVLIARRRDGSRRTEPWALRHALLILAVGAGGAALAFTVAYRATDGTDKDRFDVAIKAATATAALAAGLLTWGRLELSRRAHILGADRDLTERYSRSIEQLGHDRELVRVGAIFALERYALDAARNDAASELDWHMALDTLAALARGGGTGVGSDDGEPTTSSTVGAAVQVLGRFLERSGRQPAEPLELDLTGIVLHGADLARANLAHANLSGADLTGSDLTGANLSHANLADAQLGRVSLRTADLSDADLSRADLARATLGGACMAMAKLIAADLTGGDLTGALLAGADLSDSKLVGAVAQGAILSEADLSSSDLTDADLARADLTAATAADANFARADLSDARLGGADLERANLEGAKLSQADLTNARLGGAKLVGAYLSSADVTRADLAGTNLSEAHLEGADITGVRISRLTSWPDGFERAWLHDAHRLDQLRMLGDEDADPLVAGLLSRRSNLDQRDLVRLVLNELDEADAPHDNTVRDWIMSGPALPPWADDELIHTGQGLFGDWPLAAVTTLFCVTLPTTYAATDAAQVLAMTSDLATGNVARRVTEITQMLIDIMDLGRASPATLHPGGVAYQSIRGVRLLHALVRQTLLAAGRTGHATEDPASPHWRPEWGIPINQEDLIGTMFAFSVAALHGLDRLRVPYESKAADAYIHTWCVVGELIGIRPGILPIRRSEAEELGDRYNRRHHGQSETGHRLMRALLVHMETAMPLGLRKLPRTLVHHLAPEVAALLGVPRPVVWRPILAVWIRATPILQRLPGGIRIAQAPSSVFGRTMLQAYFDGSLRGEGASIRVDATVLDQLSISPSKARRTLRARRRRLRASS
jgi:uncharacterized protein YjbI with pentapeptide repeats